MYQDGLNWDAQEYVSRIAHDRATNLLGFEEVSFWTEETSLRKGGREDLGNIAAHLPTEVGKLTGLLKSEEGRCEIARILS